MKAFHNKESIKAKYLNRVQAHAKADEIIKGKYWEDGKGCAVGCTIHSDQHNAYEVELGIPEWLAYLEDTLFEVMPLEDAKLWPEQFLSAINVGAELEKVKVPFIIYTLKDSIKSMDAAIYDKTKFPEVTKVIEGSKAAVLEMIRVLRLGLDTSAARSAASSARSVSSVAYSAAISAALAAYSDANSDAYSAAWSAGLANSAARSAYWAAASAAHSARVAACLVACSAADSANSAANSNSHKKYSVYLLKLLRGCK